jgi:hypothetical protein
MLGATGTFVVTRGRELHVPAEDALTAFFYDLQTADPWRTDMKPKGRGQGELTVTHTSPDGTYSSLAILSVRRDGQTIEVDFSSDNRQGSFKGLISFLPKDDHTVMSYIATVTPTPEGDRGIKVSEEIYTSVVDQILDRVEALCSLVNAPGRQLHPKVLAAARDVVAMVDGHDITGLGA